AEIIVGTEIQYPPAAGDLDLRALHRGDDALRLVESGGPERLQLCIKVRKKSCCHGKSRCVLRDCCAWCGKNLPQKATVAADIFVKTARFRSGWRLFAAVIRHTA